jgi:crotonobetainyl-CoA:carnitine CoA-transferase CaiB-like acyl-CoA transferase
MSPLAGIRVLDFSSVFAGPHCGQLLADYGADVIKIEPKAGDDARNWQPLHEGKPGSGTLFFVVNRNKRSLVIDLKSDSAAAVVRRLVRQCDVVLQNFSAGVMDRLGIGYEQLREENARLIYCSISAFGEVGPMARARGYDPVMQAFSGMMSIGEPDGPPPLRLSVPLIDFTTGQNAFAGILAAIIERNRTGTGSFLEVCLADSAVALQAWGLQRYWGTAGLGAPAQPMGRGVPDKVPYEAFQASDGFVYIACGNDRLWAAFCAAIDRPDLATHEAYALNASRREHYDTLMQILRPLVAARPCTEWEQLLVAAGVPCAPVNDLAGLASHPQTIASGIVQEYESPHFGRLKAVARAVRFGGRLDPVGKPPPALGEHTRAVLLEAGFSDAEIDAYCTAGVVAAP